MKINEIKDILSKIDDTDTAALEEFRDTYSDDVRSGVKALAAQADKRLILFNKEQERTEVMYAFEKKYRDMGYKYICGIDEVGRGPLAGPVVSCAVILPTDSKLYYLNDSKQVSRKKREELYDVITAQAVAYGIGISSEQRIDEINILQATYESMRMAVNNLRVCPDILLNDAVHIPDIDIKQVPIIKGDTLSASIAAASIVAKVTRDRMMTEYDKLYPEYDFASNMGYGSAKHLEALASYGPSDIHRRTFIKKYI